MGEPQHSSVLRLESPRYRRYHDLSVTSGSILFFFLLRITIVSVGFQLLIQGAVFLANTESDAGGTSRMVPSASPRHAPVWASGAKKGFCATQPRESLCSATGN